MRRLVDGSTRTSGNHRPSPRNTGDAPMVHGLVRAAAAVIAIATFAPATFAQVVTVGFNSATDLNNFVINDQNLGPPAGAVFTFNATAGIKDNNGQPGG